MDTLDLVGQPVIGEQLLEPKNSFKLAKQGIASYLKVQGVRYGQSGFIPDSK